MHNFKTMVLASCALSGVCFASNGDTATGGGTAATPSKPKTVAENMPNRRIFPNVEQATAFLNLQGEELSDFGSVTLASAGIDSEGNFDPAVYTDDMDIMVAKLNRQKGGVKAIVIAPVPKLNVLLNMDAETYEAIPAAHREWLAKILHKEMNHVAVRQLRDAEDVSTVVDQIPTTIAGYIESGRDAGGGIMEAFNELYKQINATLSKLPIWAKARLIKSDLRKAMESAGYAREFYAALEDYKGESLFVAAAKLGANSAKRKGLDPTIFERWLESRDKKDYKPGEDDEDELDFDDIDALTDALIATEAKDAAESATPETETDTTEGATEEAETTADSTETAETTTDEQPAA